MPRPASKEPRVRLNLEVSVEIRERIERLREQTEADTATEVIKRALRVYDTLLNLQTLEGQLVFKMKDGSERRLIIIP